MKVFVVIVTYNGSQWYMDLFTSLRNSDISLNVVVVDNNSNDNTVEFIESNFPEIKLFKSNLNLGFGKGNNLGMKYAIQNNADYVFLLNQDAKILSNTISDLIKIAEKNPNGGIFSPMHLNWSGEKIESGLLSILSNHHLSNRMLLDDLFFNRLKDKYEVNYVNAAAWLLPANTIKLVGGFDPIFFHYGEDDNYLNRVHFKSLKVYLCPKVIIFHDTEKRKIDDKFIKFEKYKMLLIKFTNLNSNENLFIYLVYCLRKILFNTITFNFKNSKGYFLEFVFLFNHISKINSSKRKYLNSNYNWIV